MTKNLLTAKDLHLRYGEHIVFENLNFNLLENKKIGLVGINGSGKSSLIRLLAGNLDPDGGEIFKSNDLKIQYLPQDFDLPDGKCKDYLLPQKETDTDPFLESRVMEILKNFGFKDLQTDTQSLSGGQQRQIALARTLSQKADLVLLDEPTNHLDFITLLKLQKIIQDYTGTILMISHDRYFLDKTITETWELHNKKLYFHSGNYSNFTKDKNSRQEVELLQFEKRKQELRRELEWVNSGVKARGTKDQGRLNRYFELKGFHDKNKPIWKKPSLPIPKPEPLGNKILILKELEVEMPGESKKTLIKDLDLEFVEGMRLGILGPNGSGKTTLIQTILGNYKPKKGKIIYGQNTIFNYQDQKRQMLDPHKNILQILSEGNIQMEFGNTKTNIYAYLKKFLFTSHDLQKRAENLSGGQKARLLLAKILKQGGNFLILDEPTNDLDVDTMESLENTLTGFEGCLILVSHDRFFLDQICTHVLALENNDKWTFSSGNYTNYIQKYGNENDFWNLNGNQNQSINLKTSEPNHNWENLFGKNKNLVNQKEQRKLKANIRNLEKEIQKQEQILEILNQKIAKADFYQQSSDIIQKSLKKLETEKQKLEEMETNWLELQEKIED
jgi:ATP-binding cassette subfamily F protein uup